LQAEKEKPPNTPKILKKPITVIATILCIYQFNAQNLNHDLGILIGSTNLQSDYGSPESIPGSFTNNGTSLTIAHYLGFSNGYSRWNQRKLLDHLRVKTEIKYLINGDFEHTGKYSKKNNSNAEKLSAMKGSLKMFDLGINLEYYMFSVDEINNFNYSTYLNPYVSFGFKYSFYTNGITSELGNWEEDRTLLADWYSGKVDLDVGKNNAFSFCSGIGIRNMLTPKIDLVAQVSFQYFFSDSIDGLIHTKNDSSVNIQLGIIYQLNTK
jgi:hypothetical protein